MGVEDSYQQEATESPWGKDQGLVLAHYPCHDLLGTMLLYGGSASGHYGAPMRKIDRQEAACWDSDIHGRCARHRPGQAYPDLDRLGLSRTDRWDEKRPSFLSIVGEGCS